MVVYQLLLIKIMAVDQWVCSIQLWAWLLIVVHSHSSTCYTLQVVFSRSAIRRGAVDARKGCSS